MADPLSIIVGTTALVGTVIKTTNTIVRFYRGAGDLGENLVFLNRELKSLQGALEIVYSCLQAPKFLQGVAQFEKQSGNSIIDIFVQQLNNAESSVQHLETVYAKFVPKSGTDASWFERGLNQNKLEHMYDEIVQIRQQIQSHICALQLGLSALNSCHQLQNAIANHENAFANRQNATANRGNADANRQNAAASRENAVLSRAILNHLERMNQQSKDLGKHQDKLQATQRQTGIESAEETRMIDDMEKLRRLSIDIESTARRRMSIVLPTIGATTRPALKEDLDLSSNAKSPDDKIQQRPALTSVFEDREQSEFPPETFGRADPEVSHLAETPVRPVSEKRYNSSDDAVLPALDSPHMRPPNERSVASSPALGRVTDSHNEPPAITSEEFEEKISSAISMAEKGKKEPKEPFNDSDFDLISSLLAQVGKSHWSERPRTYLILRLIGHVKAMEGFILEGLNDIAFPYSSQNQLPASLRGHRARQEFLDKQGLVLTPKAADLVSGGRHRHIGGDADAGFKHIQNLGKGGQGMVDKVTSKLDLQIYARKRIRKPKELGRNKVAMRTFENEVHNLKRLEHQHLVKFVGSYTDCKYVGIIMEPVADTDLKEYLTRDPFPEVELNTLRSFFGCLCSALHYLHQHNCRHKDIKPANILIKAGHVYITDFGIALDWTELNRDTTVGPALIYTHAYAAPEVTKGLDRNTKSDIWSLGCVFLDILTVLKGNTLDQKKSFLARSGSVVDVSLNLHGIEGWVDTLAGINNDDHTPLQWIKSMLKEQRDDRPTAADLRAEFTRSSKGKRYCGNCCLDDEDSDSDSFRGSDTDEEPGMTSESYTRTTLLSNTESGASRNDGETLKTDRVAQNQKGKLLTDFQAMEVASGANSDAQGTTLTLQNRLTSLLFLEHSKLEELLLEERETNKKSWESSMLNAGTSPATDSKFRSLLHVAVTFTNRAFGRETVKLLLRAHASPDNPDFAHNTPLHYAVASQDALIVKDLLAKGSDPTKVNLRLQTPLHIAGRLGDTIITKRILRAYLPSMIDVKDDCGNTALHLACESKRVEAVVALLDAGADPHVLDDEGRSAFDVFDTKSYKERQDENENQDLLASPSFEDFLNEEFGILSRSRSDPSEVFVHESSGKSSSTRGRSCKCQVCKILNALDGVTDIDGDATLACPCASHIFEIATEMLCNDPLLEKDLCGCDCIECERARCHNEDEGGSLEGGKQAGEEEGEVQDNDGKISNDDNANDEHEHKHNRSPPVELGLKSPERPEDGPCELYKSLGYQGHDYWDGRIAALMSTYPPRNVSAAQDVLTSAGFAGRKSYDKNPRKAWIWAGSQASRLTSIESVVELLLDHGAYVDYVDEVWGTFLHIASWYNHIPLAKLLIDRGADVHAASRGTGFTPLDDALYFQNFEMARLILREGYDLRRDDVVNWVVEGTRIPSTNGLPMLLAHKPDLEKEYKGLTALQSAVVKGDVECARLLIAAGSNVDCVTDHITYGGRPLPLAIRERNIDMVELLLNSGASTRAYVRGGRSRPPALFHAARYGPGAVVSRLLEIPGAAEDVNYRDYKSEGTPLHLVAEAAGDGMEQATRELISAGAEVNARDPEGNQPLHAAALRGKADLVRLLVDAGAEVNAKNDLGQTACDVAVKARHKEVAGILGGDVKKKKWYKRI